MNAGGAAGVRALIALSVGALLIGLAPIFVRLADVGPTAAAFWRCALAWPLLWMAARNMAGAVPAPPAPWLLLAAGLFFAFDLSLWHIALGKTSVANATLLANLAPLFVAPAAWLLWRERITRGFVLGMLVALGGTMVLMGNGLHANRTQLEGDLLAVGAAAFYSGYLLCVSRLRRTHSTLHILAWISATVAVVLLPVAWLAGEQVMPASAQGWAVLAGLALLTHVGGQGLITWSMATLPASLSAVGLLVTPLAAAIFAWVLLSEGFGSQQALGGAVILGGILCCRLASGEEAPATGTRRTDP